MKKTIVVTIFAVMIVSMIFINVNSVKAETITHQDLQDGLNLWGQWQKLNINGFYLFSTAGNIRHCGYNDPSKCEGNPIWCGQPDTLFERPKGTVLTKTEIMSNCPTDRKNGALMDIYYNGYILEIDMTNRNSYTLPEYSGVEVYCCECATACEEKCTNGDKQQYVCSGASKVCYSYCNQGTWQDKCEDCPTGKSCTQSGGAGSCKSNECTPGETDCKSDTVRRTCSNSGKWVEVACSSGQTCSDGVCFDGGNENMGTAIKMEKVDDATGAMWLRASCELDSDCGKITNYTVYCSGKQEIIDKAQLKIQKDYPDCLSCMMQGGKNFFQSIVWWFGGKVPECSTKCTIIDVFKQSWAKIKGEKAPVGFCLAEENNNGNLCLLKVSWFGTGMDQCTQGWIVIAGGIVMLIILMSAMGGGRR